MAFARIELAEGLDLILPHMIMHCERQLCSSSELEDDIIWPRTFMMLEGIEDLMKSSLSQAYYTDQLHQCAGHLNFISILSHAIVHAVQKNGKHAATDMESLLFLLANL